MKKGKILQSYSFDEANQVKSLAVDFTIVCDNLNPSLVTKETGIVPNHSWRKGEIYQSVSSKTGKSRSYEKVHGLWRVTSYDKVDSFYINDHISYVLAIVEPSKDYFKSLCKIQEFRVFFHVYRECFDGQGFFCISSDNMLRMADMCQEIEFLCPVEITEDVEDESKKE